MRSFICRNTILLMDFLEKRITAQKKEEEGRRFLLVYIYILRSVTLSFFLITKYTYMRAREFIDISFFLELVLR